jgi:hypothetical protein
MMMSSNAVSCAIPRFPNSRISASVKRNNEGGADDDLDQEQVVAVPEEHRLPVHGRLRGHSMSRADA